MGFQKFLFDGLIFLLFIVSLLLNHYNLTEILNHYKTESCRNLFNRAFKDQW